MTSFLAVPLKKTNDIDLSKPLKNLIASHYSTSDDPINLNTDIDNINKLRSICTSKTLDVKHESSLESLERYCDQLSSLESKCPPNEVQISFKWKDAFDKGGSFLLSSSSLSIPSISYEKVCVLFNIAAIQTQIAAVQSNDGIFNDSALKSTAKYLQSASGIFQGLKHLATAAAGSYELNFDMQFEILHILQSVAVAQAQETFYHKAVNDSMKGHVIAKIANQCEEYYNEANKNLQIVKIPNVDKDWSTVVPMKQAAFAGLAEYHQSTVCREKKEFGEQISRLQKAVEYLKASESRGGLFFSNHFRDQLAKASRELEESVKDNDFIYHAKITAHKSLPSIGKALLAKPTSIPEKFRPNIPDPFDKLLPVSVQQSIHRLDLRKQEIVNGEIAKMREQAQLLNGTLASLNLPAALEDSSGVSLPPSLREKAASVKAKGGIGAIDQLINELPELLQRNREILDETERILTAEEESDTKLRSQFKEKWNRVPSGKINTFWKDHIKKYRNIIQNAVDADRKVQQKYNSHRDKMQLLSADSDDELMRALPSGSGSGNSLDSPCVLQLRQLMTEIESIRSERQAIETGLKDAVFDDMKSKFLDSLAKDGAINEEALSVESLGAVYGPLQKRVRESNEAQIRIVSEIQRANEEFIQVKKAKNLGDSKRESFMSELAAAHDVFQELLSNLSEGTRFYNDLTQLLVSLQGKVSDFCFARKSEREELCKDLQNAIVSQPNPAPPNAPSYHNPEAPAAAQQRPPRPPPPTQQSQQQQPQTAPNLPFAQPQNPYAGAPAQVPNPYQQYFTPPPPLPQGYNPYGQTPAYPPQQQPQQQYPGYPPQQQQYPPQQQWPQHQPYGQNPAFAPQPQPGYTYPNYPYPQQQPPTN